MTTVINKIKKQKSNNALFLVANVCSTCEGKSKVIINANCCGACDFCGNAEEKEVPCPDCTSFYDEDTMDREE